MKKARVVLFVCLFTSINYSLLAKKVDNPAKEHYHADSLALDSVNVRFIGNWPFGRPYQVAYDSLRDIVFMSSGAGIYIIDISDPVNPVKISESLHSREFINWDLFYDYNTQRLYIGVARWFEIWDVSNPALPTMLGSFSTSGLPGSEGGICVSGSYAYCVDDSCFCVVDVSVPSHPQILGGLPVYDGRAVAIKDSFAYIVSTETIGFRVIKISDPQNPEEVSFLGQKGRDIAIFGDRAYISSFLGLKLRIIDISNPYNPQFCGYFDSPDEVYQAHVIDTIMYLAAEHGLRIVNIADPMDPQEIAYFFCRGRDIFVKDTLSYVVDRDTGLRIFDVTSPSSPMEIGQFITPGRSYESQVSGAFAYIANEKGLWVIDVSDPAHAREVGRCYTPLRISGVRISGSYAFAPDRDSSLFVFDISDPQNPFIASVLKLPTWPRPEHKSIEISGQFAYIADTNNGLRIVDISNPLFPYEAAQCTIFFAIDVAISGIYAYVAGVDKLTVVDVSNPFNPEIVVAVSKTNIPSEICISGTYAFVSDSSWGEPGLHTFDISDLPPQKINYHYQPQSTGVHISGLYAYFPCEYAFFRVLDISQPSNPIRKGYYAMLFYDFSFWSIFSVGTIAYVSTDCGLQIHQFYGAGVEEEPEEALPIPTALKLLQNPVTGSSIKLMLTTNNPDNCIMSLYNVLGQEMKAFNLENLSVGKNHLDLPINKIPNGVYFLKVKGDMSISPEKVVVLK